MSFSFGKHLRVSIFGQSHAPAVGVSCEGLPAGLPVDEEALQAFLQRRAPGKALTTPRSEQDKPVFLSGLTDGKTNGAPLTAVIYNTNTRSADYSELRAKPRPGHSDYPASVKFDGCNDIAGGGQFSARLTAPLCIIGGIVMQQLHRQGVEITAHIRSVHGIEDDCFDALCPDASAYSFLQKEDFPVLNPQAGERMRRAVEDARKRGDSVGGTVECIVTGLPVGVGDGGYGGLDGEIASVVFGIPAVKGIAFGAGFAAAGMMGSENNDAYFYDNGAVRTETNHAGGILGGMSTGMPVLFTVAFKPTPSIALEQKTVDLQRKENTTLMVHGRHDPCVAIRAVPVVEAAAAVAVYEKILGD